MDYRFFLSYAREDNTDMRKDQRGVLNPFVQLFYEDLCREIRSKVGLLKGEEVGFFDDAKIEPGEDWPEKLASALQQSHVFIGLYSPTYFKKEYCGKEWAVFTARVEAYAKNPASRLVLVEPMRVFGD
jgi:TIR domain-containing protein